MDLWKAKARQWKPKPKPKPLRYFAQDRKPLYIINQFINTAAIAKGVTGIYIFF